MKKHLISKHTIIRGFVAAVFLFLILSFTAYQWILHIPAATIQNVPASVKLVVPSHSAGLSDDMFFGGVNGVNELTLLKKAVPVEQDPSGLVVSINGRKADPAKHEFWAFYVNGKMASVGPAEYITKEGDKIEWKIEKY